MTRMYAVTEHAPQHGIAELPSTTPHTYDAYADAYTSLRAREYELRVYGGMVTVSETHDGDSAETFTGRRTLILRDPRDPQDEIVLQISPVDR